MSKIKAVKATGSTKDNGWSWSMETLKGIENELDERGWSSDLEDINELLEVLHENGLLVVSKLKPL